MGSVEEGGFPNFDLQRFNLDYTEEHVLEAARILDDPSVIRMVNSGIHELQNEDKRKARIQAELTDDSSSHMRQLLLTMQPVDWAYFLLARRALDSDDPDRRVIDTTVRLIASRLSQIIRLEDLPARDNVTDIRIRKP